VIPGALDRKSSTIDGWRVKAQRILNAKPHKLDFVKPTDFDETIKHGYHKWMIQETSLLD